MTAEPTLAEIEAAASVPIHYFDTARYVTRTDVLSLADAEQVLIAAYAVHDRVIEARLREQIAGEIEALTPRAVDRPDLHAQGWRDAVGVAARIARGR